MHRSLSLAALAAALVTAPAHAAHVIAGWYTWVTPEAYNLDGSYVEAFIQMKKGIVEVTKTQGGGTVDAGPLMPDATSIWATANATFEALSANASGSADLTTGTVKAEVTLVEGDDISVKGASQSILRDGLYFTNTTAAWLSIGYWLDVDGAIVGVREGLGGVDTGIVNWTANAPTKSFSCSDQGQCVGFAADGSAPANSEFRAAYTATNGLSFGDQNDQAAAWTVTTKSGHDVSAGLFAFTMATTLWVPPGETTLMIEPQIDITFCGYASGTCRFDLSARLGPAPQGLSWTSESGAFLSGLGSIPGPGGVIPEPATWAMLIAGFGKVGLAARRRAFRKSRQRVATGLSPD